MKKGLGILTVFGLVLVMASSSSALMGAAVTYGAASYGSVSPSLVGIEIETPMTNLPIPMVATRWAYQTGRSGTVTVSPLTVNLAIKIPVTSIYAFANTGIILVSDTSTAVVIPGPFTFGGGVGYEYSLAPTVSAFAQLGLQSATISTAGYNLNLSGSTYVIGLRAGL